MKSLKLLTLGATLTLALVFSAQAAFANTTPAETKTLATIAAIDKNEILIGLVAKNKKITHGVKDLANMMIDQHSANLTQILEMANQLHAMPLTSSTAIKLTAAGNKGMLQIAALNGNQFDHAYVNAMVSGHEAALKLIDTQLMQTAQSAEMKKFMVSTRATVAMHLACALKLQKKMGV